MTEVIHDLDHDSLLSQHLEISNEDWDAMGVELHANTGSNDEGPYCYWFEVPENTPEEILEKTGWKVGQTVNDIPVEVVDVDDEYDP